MTGFLNVIVISPKYRHPEFGAGTLGAPAGWQALPFACVWT